MNESWHFAVALFGAAGLFAAARAWMFVREDAYRSAVTASMTAGVLGGLSVAFALAGWLA